MNKTAAELIEPCKSKIGTPYVYGAKGEVLTQAILDRLAGENPGTYTSTYKAKAARYIGQRCTDCSGLISWYTGRIRGSYNYHDTVFDIDYTPVEVGYTQGFQPAADGQRQWY